MRIPLTLIALPLLLPLLSCSALANEQDWAFVQSVGGIKVEAPTRNATGWLLPVQADVSGLSKITVQPTLLNSALTCKKVKTEIEGNAIYLTLVTGLVSDKESPLCPPAALGGIAQGQYIVYYRSRNEQAVKLTEITITP